MLIEVLTQIQNGSGREVPVWSDDIRPLKDLDGFDSLNAEEAAAFLSNGLGFEIEKNPFVSPKGKLLSIQEAAAQLAANGSMAKVGK